MMKRSFCTALFRHMAREKWAGKRREAACLASSSRCQLQHPLLSSSLLSSLVSPPLTARAVRGSCSGDIIMSHFTRVLPSISPRININHPFLQPPPPPPHSHNNPFVSAPLLINTDVKRSSKKMAYRCTQTYVNDHISFLLPTSFLSHWLYSSNHHSRLNCP